MKKTIHYALILDQSGSMHHLKKEVVTSFNEQIEMISKMTKNEPEIETKITFCKFNDEIRFKYIAQNITQLKKLTAKDYQPNSCTALYDAIGITMLKINEIRQSDDKVFLVIFTDGLENASTDYIASDIQHKLKKVENEGWEIKFFCRYEDSFHYKKNLNLSDNMQFCISVNEDGLKLMEEQVEFNFKKMINEGK